MDPGFRLGAFTLDEPIARGGMGEVWRARHPSGMVAAVKVLVPEGSDNETWIDSLNAEIRAVAGLAHPNIVRIYDTGLVSDQAAQRSDGRLPSGGPWFAMELADGGTLKDRRIASFPDLQILLHALLAALAHGHARGIVHRDLKPANILFADGVPKLTDFGLVFSTDPTRPGAQLGGGTPAYMAPEQFDGDRWSIGPWTDLYSLGIVAYTIVHGQKPFRIKGWRQLHNAHLFEPPPPLKPTFDVPAGLEDWILRLLAKDRHQRFRHAADAADALFQVAEGARAPFAAPVLPDHRGNELSPEPLPSIGLGLHGLRTTPFVGRRIERAQLWDALTSVAEDGASRAVVLRGPAGVGKSRLAEWLCQRANAEGGVPVFRTVHSPLPSSLDGAAGLLARALQIRGDDADEVRSALAEELAPRGIRDPNVHRALVGMITPTLDTPQLSAEQRHTLVGRVLRAITGRRPAIVWLDDVQWGAAAIDLARHLLTNGPGLPVLVLLTVRDEAIIDEPDASTALDRLLDDPAASTVEVRPLTRRAGIRLLERGLGLGPNLAARLQQRTAGNPMFAVELVGDWIHRGLLVPGPQGFELADADALRMPATIGAVWDARIDHLCRHQPAWELPLMVAAALGMTVDETEWAAAVTRLDAIADPALWARLAETRLVRIDPVTGHRAFVHGVLRETLLERARQQSRLTLIHEAIAAVVSDEARRGLHLLSTPRYLEGAAQLLTLAERTVSIRPRRTLRLLQLRDESLERRQHDGPERAQGWVLASRTCRGGSDAEHALRWARMAKHWSEQHRDLDMAVLALQECAASARCIGQLDRAKRYIDNALVLCADMSPDVRSDTHFHSGAVLIDTGDLAGAEHMLTRAVEHAQDPYRRARAGIMLGYTITQRGRLQEAKATLLRVIPDAKAAGRRGQVADLHNALGEIARTAGDLDEASKRYRLAIRASRDAVDPAFSTNLALVHIAANHFADAEELLVAVLKLASRQRVRVLELIAHSGLAACAAHAHDWKALREHLGVLRDDTTGVAAPDLARMLEITARLADEGGEDRMGRVARQAAARQYRALGREADAMALEG